MLRTLFVLVILVPGLIAAIRNRFAALLLYLWFALFRPQEWLWIDISGLRLSMILSLFVIVPTDWLLASRARDKAEVRRWAAEAWPNMTHPLTIGMMLTLGLALLAQIHAVDPPTGWLWIDYLWRVLLVSMVTVSLTWSRERFWAVVLVAGASLGFHATKGGISSLLEGGLRYGQGLGGAFIDSNGYALGIVMILPFLVAAAQNTDRPWLKWTLLGSVLPCVYTVVSTFSRAGFLATVASVIVFAALQRRRIAALSAVAAIGVVVLLVVPIPKGYFDRIETIQTYEEVNEESAMSRIHFWRVAADMARANPFGVGLRNYDAAYNRYDFLAGRYGVGRSVHSSHFQMLAETGYAGFVLWVTLFAYALFACFRVRSRSTCAQLSEAERHFYFTMANGLIVSMAGFLLGGSFIALALNDLTWLTFALVAALDRLSAKAIEVPSAAPAFGAHPGAAVAPEGRFKGEYRSPRGTLTAGVAP